MAEMTEDEQLKEVKTRSGLPATIKTRDCLGI